MKNLFELKPGDIGIVESYRSHSHKLSRLRDLGLVEGTRFGVVHFAPMGDPIEIKFRGFHLCNSRSAATQINVKSENNVKM